jgi:tellurite resistance protein TerA
MSSIGNSSFKLIENGEEKLSFAFTGSDFSSEKAIIIAELYFKDQWRVSAVGQGFSGGLSALLKHFGGEEAAPPARETPKVRLGKVSLDKRGDAQKVDLTKGGQQPPIHINLQWNSGSEGEKKSEGGFFGLFRSSGASAVDLDLGCMYRLKSGECGVIQPLGGNFGSKTQAPYILLDKDDRSGAATDGENMYVYRPEDIDLMVVFALIYEGTAQFSAVSGNVTIQDGKNFEISIPLNNPDDGMRFCAVARIEAAGDSIRIVKDELYFKGHEFCDRHYGFGFRWKAGRK